MNKLHPAVALAAAFAGAFAAVSIVRSLLTTETVAPKQITSDIPAPPVAPAPQVAEPAPAEGGTVDGAT